MSQEDIQLIDLKDAVSNAFRPIEHLFRIFKDSMTTAAAIDRMVHHCVILELDGQSYRNQEAQRRSQQRCRQARAWYEQGSRH